MSTKHTPWNKGVPWSEEDYKKFAESEKFQKAQAEFRMRVKQPKTEEQKAKMSAAKLNKPKTEEHKSKMSASQKRRHELRKQLLESNPEMPVETVWEKVKEIL